MKNRFIRWIFFLLIGVGIGALWGYFDAKKEMNDGIIALSPDDQAAVVIKKPSRVKDDKNDNEHGALNGLGGNFDLVDHNGKQVTQDDYADTYKLIFFGFTYCPAICPTELQKVALIMNELDEETAAKITPIFVTVDPERDTVEQMKQYVAQFHPKLIGLTGTQEQIDVVKKAYRVYATKVENEMMEEYMMDHSAFLYLVAPDNKVQAIYPSKDTFMKIADDIKGRSL